MIIVIAPLIIILIVVKNIKSTVIQKWHHASIIVFIFTYILLKINSCPKEGFCDMAIPMVLLLPVCLAGLIILYTSTKFILSKMLAFNYINIFIRIIDFAGVALAVYFLFAISLMFTQ